MLSSDCRCSHIWLLMLTMRSGTLDPVSLHRRETGNRYSRHPYLYCHPEGGSCYLNKQIIKING